MLLIKKPGTDKLRTVFDLREQNANTCKLASPLLDMEGVIQRAASHPFLSVMDNQSAFEHIRIEPDHVPRTAISTPHGNMVSNVIQIGDCNAPATYQALMNHLFSAYIGRFMDVYLDNIVIYSDTLAEHIEHVKTVIDILCHEKIYLSEHKLHFLCSEVKILRHVIDKDGIRMDPDKVDGLINWKTPTSRELLCGFLGMVSYLADDIDRIQVPMGILHAITGDTVPFCWDFTLQRAFEDVKTQAILCKTHHRRPLEYGPDKPQINVVTDGCGTSISGLVSQGDDWQTAKVAKPRSSQ